MNRKIFGMLFVSVFILGVDNTMPLSFNEKKPCLYFWKLKAGIITRRHVDDIYKTNMTKLTGQMLQVHYIGYWLIGLHHSKLVGELEKLYNTA